MRVTACPSWRFQRTAMTSQGLGWVGLYGALLIAAVACGSTAVEPEQPEKTGPVSALLLRVTTSRPEVGPGDLLIIDLTATNPLPIPIVAQVTCPFPGLAAQLIDRDGHRNVLRMEPCRPQFQNGSRRPDRGPCDSRAIIAGGPNQELRPPAATVCAPGGRMAAAHLRVAAQKRSP